MHKVLIERDMKRIILLVAVAVVACAGCSSKREAEPAVQEPAAVEEKPAEENTRERTITLTPRKEPPAPQPARVVSRSRPVMQRDQILSLRGGEVFGPEDYEIGVLQGYSDDRNIKAILERIRSFQKGLSAGTVPLADVHPDWAEQAQRSLNFHLERGNIPSDVRVGAIEIYAPGVARANIRLTGDPGIAFGEIYLKESDTLWLVNDLQLDMADLSEVPEQKEEPYEPSVYRMTNIP